MPIVSPRVAYRQPISRMIRAEHEIPTASIDERTTSPVSVMPAGLVDDLTAAEFAALVDYVVSLKPLH